MTRFPCPYLGGDVELSDARERHIEEHHPDLLPDHKIESGTRSLTQTRFAEVNGLGMRVSFRNGMMTC
jgi:hypothetical protein